MILSLLACFTMQMFNTPIPYNAPWTHASNEERFEEAWDYAKTQNGRALIVLEGEKTIFEAYASTHNNESPLPIYSTTKTLACFLAYTGEQEGFFSLDEKVSNTFIEWQEDPHKKNITVRQLLQFTSGIEQQFLRLTVDGFQPPEKQKIKNKYAYARTLAVEYPPGTSWSYGSSHLTLFADFFARKTNVPIQSWLENHIFSSIGFRYAGWNSDPKGNHMLAYGIWTSAPEMVKLGVLIRDDGLFFGKRVLSSGIQNYCKQSSPINPAYGMGIWQNRDMPDHLEFSGPAFSQPGLTPILHISGIDISTFAGAKGQRIYIIPAYDWVVVVQSENGDDFHDPTFLNHLLSSVSP